MRALVRGWLLDSVRLGRCLGLHGPDQPIALLPSSSTSDRQGLPCLLGKEDKSIDHLALGAQSVLPPQK